MVDRVTRWIAQDDNGGQIDPPTDFDTARDAAVYERSYRLRMWLIQQIAGGQVGTEAIDETTLRAACDVCAAYPRQVRDILVDDPTG